MNSLSSLDLYFLLKELDIIPSKVDQIYQKDKEEILLQMHKTGEGKFLIRIHLPGLIYLSKYKGDQPTEPPGFCKFLRKRLKNAWLQNIEQIGFERILDLTFTTKEAKFHLFIELFSDGNMILTDEELKIISPLTTGNWKDRTIRGGTLYTYPKRELNIIDITLPEFETALKNSEKESIVKTLALDFGLGGKYAEYLCTLAKVDKDIKSKDADAKTLYNKSKDLLAEIPAGYINKKEIHPLPLENTEKKFEKFYEALDEILTSDKVSKEHNVEVSKQEKEVGKIQRIVDGQLKTIKDTEKKIEENTKAGELIYNNFQQIDDLIKNVNLAAEECSWEELKKKLKGHKVIKSLDTKEKTITIELE